MATKSSLKKTAFLLSTWANKRLFKKHSQMEKTGDPWKGKKTQWKK
jgi:hypothetical protein